MPISSRTKFHQIVSEDGGRGMRQPSKARSKRELSESSSDAHGSEFSISSHEQAKKRKVKDLQKTTGTGDPTCHVLVWPWSAAFVEDLIVEYPKAVM